VTGPTRIDLPPVKDIVHVRTAAEMHHAVMSRACDQQVIVMAAAVADYTPRNRADQKVQKDGDTLTLVLERTIDILADLGLRRLSSAKGPVLVGFAAETENVVTRA